MILPALAQQPPAAPARPAGGRNVAPPIQPKPEELQQVAAKMEQIETIVKELKARHADPDLVGDVEVYGKAGRFLLEFPDQFFTQNGINHALAVLDTGIGRAKQLQSGQSPWTTGKKQTHAYYSAIDGSVQPYGITLPAAYDPAKPTRLYVWMHGRQNQTTESEFLFAFPNSAPGRTPVADNGQIQRDVFGESIARAVLKAVWSRRMWCVQQVINHGQKGPKKRLAVSSAFRYGTDDGISWSPNRQTT